MYQSESIAALAGALSKAQGEFPPIELSREVEVVMKSGGKYRFKYAPLDELIEKTRPVMAANGLALSQLVGAEGITTILMHASGEWIKETLPFPQAGSAQDVGAAITYRKRYAYSAILGITAELDDDGGREGMTSKTTREAPRPPKAPPARETDTSIPDNPELLEVILKEIANSEGVDLAALPGEVKEHRAAGNISDKDYKVAVAAYRARVKALEAS